MHSVKFAITYATGHYRCSTWLWLGLCLNGGPDSATCYQCVRSGKTARFVSGAQVSILGAIVMNQNGSTQQSFDRVESGTILEISPVVRDQGVDIDLFQ